ncbi:MAG: hypothetical protein IKJ43_02245 [Bacilli bacterium]|nr:hypothetical protein [Bacilli bacterium]
MEKRTVVFIIVVAFVIGGIVGFKILSNSNSIVVGKEFSLKEGEMVTVKTEDMTKIKLVSINYSDCGQKQNCISDKEFVLQVNGENYTITSIPDTIDMYNAYELLIVDGDEDHIVLNTQRK